MRFRLEPQHYTDTAEMATLDVGSFQVAGAPRAFNIDELDGQSYLWTCIFTKS